MRLWRRVVRGVLFLVGLLAAFVLFITAVLARRMVRPPRLPLWATPADVGMPFEDVQFVAADGLSLSGWFIPAVVGAPPKGTIVLVHGWTWNRLGSDASERLISQLLGSEAADLLRLALALYQDGFQVLMFDWRNHGTSEAAPPVSFGPEEAQDLLGALAYLEGRADVDNGRIGVVGFSVGSNVLLYALPHTHLIRAAIAVQPTTLTTFSQRYGRHVFGWLGQVIFPLAEQIYRWQGGRPLADVQPVVAAAHAGPVPVLFVQGSGDPWGSAADVSQMASATPAAPIPLFVEASRRSDSYHYLINNPKIVTSFFEQHFPTA